MRKSILGLVLLFISISVYSFQGDGLLEYGTAEWDSRGAGYHRIVFDIERYSSAVYVKIPWRLRSGLNIEEKGMILSTSSKGGFRSISDFKVIEKSSHQLQIVFKPVIGKKRYYLYFLPNDKVGYNWWSPTFNYLTPTDRTSAFWMKKNGLVVTDADLSKLPQARVLRIESIDSFSSFFPMEVCPTEDEINQLIEPFEGDREFLVFPESRENQVRMKETIPFKWIQSGIQDQIKLTADKNEFLTFQLSLYSPWKNLNEVQIRFSDLTNDQGEIIPATSLNCFNLSGVDWRGRSMVKKVDVPVSQVQPLWIGVDISPDQQAGSYSGNVEIWAANGKSQKINLDLSIGNSLIKNRGFDDPGKMARLQWLNSTIGQDNKVTKPYIPVSRKENILAVLGRDVALGSGGLPERINTYYSANNDKLVDNATAVLAQPIRFELIRNGSVEIVSFSDFKFVDEEEGLIRWESLREDDDLTLQLTGSLEFDGYMNYQIKLIAKKNTQLEDIRLVIPYSQFSSRYMMGLGRQGGNRPEKWDWKWEMDRANQHLWVGEVNSGLQCRLKHIEEDWTMFNFKRTGLYRDWSNEGKGGIRLSEEGKQFLYEAYTGKMDIKEGESRQFNFALLITPLKTLDSNHWNERYYHNNLNNHHVKGEKWLKEASSKGARIMNIHHANNLNPFINYPFLENEALKKLIDLADDKELRVKIYYTVRELTNYTTELWALRSLGDEVFTHSLGSEIAEQFLGDEKRDDYKAGGHPWLMEHLQSEYDPMWHDPLGRDQWNASIRTQNLSRWHNYYLEGLKWLIDNIGISGIYLDGVGYDREIMKRVRKVLDENSKDALIDLHSGNQFHESCGFTSPANLYLELMPYINSLWLGEGYYYNEMSADNWLIESSGIPFGLYSEMLHGGGNYWLGMVYGMSSRLGWTYPEPQKVWEFWDEFGIQDASIIGYWDENSPVDTGHSEVKATLYQKSDSCFIAIGNFSDRRQTIDLTIDWKKLGFNPDQCSIYTASVPGYSSRKKVNLNQSQSFLPKKGMWIIIKKESF